MKIKLWWNRLSVQHLVARRDRLPVKHRPLIEHLEDRTLLTLSPSNFNLQSIHNELQGFRDQHVLTGATIITHGFQLKNQGGDSLLTLAQSIRSFADGAPDDALDAWLLNYDVSGEGGSPSFNYQTSIVSGSPREVVLLYDWAAESNEPSAGWTEAAADALFTVIVDLGLVDPATQSSLPLHFIAHSFGSAVTSEVVEKLGAFDIAVDQVTYLDPHDFDQLTIPIDGAQQQYTVGLPQSGGAGNGHNYGATVWNNVAFADAYYQTYGSSFLPWGARSRVPTTDS